MSACSLISTICRFRINQIHIGVSDDWDVSEDRCCYLTEREEVGRGTSRVQNRRAGEEKRGGQRFGRMKEEMNGGSGQTAPWFSATH